MGFHLKLPDISGTNPTCTSASMIKTMMALEMNDY